MVEGLSSRPKLGMLVRFPLDPALFIAVLVAMNLQSVLSYLYMLLQNCVKYCVVKLSEPSYKGVYIYCAVYQIHSAIKLSAGGSESPVTCYHRTPQYRLMQWSVLDMNTDVLYVLCHVSDMKLE